MFPFAFCFTHWVQDKKVSHRLLLIWDKIKAVIKFQQSLPKSKRTQCQSYLTELEASNDDRRSHQRCSLRKGILRNFAKFTGRHQCESLFFNKVAGLRHAALFKKRLWHSDVAGLLQPLLL